MCSRKITLASGWRWAAVGPRISLARPVKRLMQESQQVMMVAVKDNLSPTWVSGTICDRFPALSWWVCGVSEG